MEFKRGRLLKKYLKNSSDLKEIGRNLINEYKLKNNSAVGVIFCENKYNTIKINPVVWVKDIDTLFLETACGSGSIAVCIVEAFLKNHNQIINILQPSGLIITARVDYNNGIFQKTIITGDIDCDKKIYYLRMDEA